MADPAVADHPHPILNAATADFDGLPIPPDDIASFSDALIPDLGGPFDGDVNVEDLDFTFDDIYLPSDTEDFLNSLSALADPNAPYPLQVFTDPSPDVPGVFSSDGVDQIPGDQVSISAGIVSPCTSQGTGDRSSDVARFLNASSMESSQESGGKGFEVSRVLTYSSPDSEAHQREVSGPASSQGSGNSGSAVSEALNYPSPDSGNCDRSAASSPSSNNSLNDAVDQKIKFEEGGNSCLLKRRKEREDLSSVSRMSKCRKSNAVDEAHTPYGSNGVGEEEDKRRARLMRNRESAQLSRQRKKHYVEELEDKVRTMHSTIQDLNNKISYIMAENANFRQQLSGGAVCPPPVPPIGMYPHPSVAPVGYPWMPCPPYVMKPQGSQVPLLPIPRLKPQQPAPAPRAKKAESKKNEGKIKKVAGVSFLGFFLFILFFGGLVPMVDVKFGGIHNKIRGGSDYLGNKFYDKNRGRVLAVNGHLNGSDENKGMGMYKGRFGVNKCTSTVYCGRGHDKVAESNVGGSHPDEFGGLHNSSVPLVASLYVPRNDKLVKIDGNLIIHSVLASEKALASHQGHRVKNGEETGLAVTGHMPPAIPLTGGNNGRHPHWYRSPSEQQRALGSASAGKDNLKSAPADGKLQQWFKEGLAGPLLSSGMCTEVFQFDVSPSPGAIVPATSPMNISAQQQNSTQLVKGRNRRILQGAPIPLAGSRSNITKKHMGRNPGKENFQGNNSLSSMVVSVLVDPRENGDSDSDGVMGKKSLSRIFVVVLIDSVKYVTYSCMLPLKGSGAQLVTT